jgi:hypothetical protein
MKTGQIIENNQGQYTIIKWITKRA